MLPNPPLVEVIAEDPMLADTKIIAEAWDAAGAFQVVRSPIGAGPSGMVTTATISAATGAASQDSHRSDGNADFRVERSLSNSGRHPYHSINFVTSHDGYTLNDLVSYEQKHNQANGEDNRDGDNNNYSANNGVEGPTRRKPIVDLRRRQVKNMMATLLLSQGTPMMVSGDEVLRTQRGNNNAYCQDNAISWFDWKLAEKNAEHLRFVQSLIEFRKAQPTVRRDAFLTAQSHEAMAKLPDVSWFSPDGKPMDWQKPTQGFICVFGTFGLDDPAARPVMILMHSGTKIRRSSTFPRRSVVSRGGSSSTPPPRCPVISSPPWTGQRCRLATS